MRLTFVGLTQECSRSSIISSGLMTLAFSTNVFRFSREREWRGHNISGEGLRRNEVDEGLKNKLHFVFATNLSSVK